MSQAEAVERGVEAYSVIADVLVNFRHIVVRAMVKNHGTKWFESPCPPEVFSRLKGRKEEELSIDRYTPEYQDLIDFADFHDLAEIIFMVADVGDLLKRLAGSSDILCNRLEELEVLRHAIATARPLDEPEIERLMFLRQGFRNFLKGKVTSPPWDEERSPVVEVKHDLPESPADSPLDEQEPLKEKNATEPEIGDEAGQHMTQPIEIQSGIETSKVEEALTSGDDARILGVIHSEVMVLAEEFYGEVLQHSPVVWVRVTDWYAQHREDLGLTALETFYGLVAEYRRRVVFEENPEDLEEFLAESRLPELLMDLREIFLAHQE